MHASSKSPKRLDPQALEGETTIDAQAKKIAPFAPPLAEWLAADAAGWRAILRQSPDPFVTPYAWPVAAAAHDAPLALRQAFPGLDDAVAAYSQRRDGAPGAYLPIELFRRQSGHWETRGGHPHFFRSSGTSASQKSLSPYGARGLALYRAGALVTFYHALRRYADDPFALKGISLIPSAVAWPRSSLATMVAWIGELWDVTYVGEDEAPPPVDATVFVFGTAFHLVNAHDAGWRMPLPAGSVVFETGGTKGKSRDVTRPELYEAIAATFAVPAARIASEYGMCELASQAYDLAPAGESLAERRFRFPAWVTPRVSTSHGVFAAEGEGALVVEDPLRVDFPWPLRIQDMVRLGRDGSFALQGRVPHAVLKGCSLNVGDVASRERAAFALVTAMASENPAPNRTPRGPIMPLTRLVTEWRAFLASEAWRRALREAFPSDRLADAAQADLVASQPADLDAWEKARAAATDGATHWLVLAPTTHPLAIMEPVLLGLANGLSFHVKAGGSGRAEDLFLAFCAEHFPGRLQVLPASFRLGRAPMPAGVEAVLLFGSDETVAAVRGLTGLPVHGYGTRIALGHVDGAATDADLAAFVKDAWSLGQRGCLSLRALLVDPALPLARDPAALVTRLHALGDALLGQGLAPAWETALDHEILPFLADGARVLEDGTRFGLFPVWAGDAAARLAPGQGLAQRPYALPIIIDPDFAHETAAADWARRHFPGTPHWVSRGGEAPFPDWAKRRPGSANIKPWDGHHEGVPYFRA